MKTSAQGSSNRRSAIPTTAPGAGPSTAQEVGSSTSRGEDVDDRDKLVMDHVGLVKTLAQRLAQRLPPQVEINDLISVGVLGLIDAASRYRASLGVPFNAFARRRVHGAMLDALRELDWAPRSLRRLRRDVDATVATLRHRLGREAREEEIAYAMDLSVDAYEKALEQLRTLELGFARQIDAPTPDGTPLIELCIDHSESAVTTLERKELKEHLARAIERLPERERQILVLYYQEDLRLAEIGEVIGVCESRVSQLRSLAISRLRTLLRSSLNLQEGVA
jgi:RNA polymerase sigma factor for flagellar operon FliA